MLDPEVERVIHFDEDRAVWEDDNARNCQYLVDGHILYLQAQKDEPEIPGGETEIQKPVVDIIDEKLPPENGVATAVGETKKHRPPPLTIPSPEKVDTLSVSSLRRATSRSSIASVRDKIMVKK